MTNTLHIFASEHAPESSGDINMYILSHDALLSVGTPYEIDVVLTNLNRTPLNAAEAEVQFDPAKIRVDGVRLHHDLCQKELLIEQSIDNKNGVVKTSCVTLTPFEGPATILTTLSLTPIGYGSTTLYFGENNNVYMHDGNGTLLSSTGFGKTYHLEGVQ